MAIKKVIVRPNLGKYIENLSILYLAKGLFTRATLSGMVRAEKLFRKFINL